MLTILMKDRTEYELNVSCHFLIVEHFNLKYKDVWMVGFKNKNGTKYEKRKPDKE